MTNPFIGSLAPMLELILLEKKSEVEKLCRTKVIRKADLAELILAGEFGMLPWHHMRYHRQFAPEHLIPTDAEQAAMATAKVGVEAPRLAQKFMSKIGAMIDERRMISGHMFVTPDQKDWHFFYFDQRDVDPYNNHWTHGPHIHYLNHLWPNRTAQSVWTEFTTGNPIMKKSLHIRFHEDREEDER